MLNIIYSKLTPVSDWVIEMGTSLGFSESANIFYEFKLLACLWQQIEIIEEA